MRSPVGAALAALLAVAAAPPGKTYPTGRFEIAGHLVPPAAVLDARAIPDMSGKPSLMVTLDARTAAALATGDAPVAASLDGRALGSSPADALRSDHVLQLSGAFGDYPSVAAMARRISGRDPLPDSENDE